jgi:fatty-acyl-CoA synthase
LTTVADLLAERAGDERPALVFEGRTWTWAEVHAEAQARASAMQARSHYGILMENTPEHVFLLAAAAMAGAVAVGLNPTRRGEELARDVRHTDCRAVLADEVGRRALEGLDLGVAAVLTSLAAPSPWSPCERAAPVEDDLFLLIFTSGSTGHPKAVKVSHGRAVRSSTRFPFGPDDVLYCAMPLFHGNALFSNLVPGFRVGCRVVLRRRFSASAFLDDVRQNRCTFFNTVGRAVAHILATPPTDRDQDHSLKWVLAPETSDADGAAFTARFGVPVVGGYGSSENAVVLQPAPRAAHPGALGVAGPRSDVAVVDPDTGAELPRACFDPNGRLLNAAEAIGELVGRDAAERFEGYYNDPAAEAERRRGGWYWTGDLAYRDEDGVFYFAGRSGDWLRVDSENFTAAPIERILARAPGVAGAAVYPVPDPRSGDQVMAAVEMAPGEVFDPSRFAEFLAAQPDLGPKWVPSIVRVVERLPTTGTDKLDKKPLRAQAWRTTDPLWRREARTMRFAAMTRDDIAAVEAELDAAGRSQLLGR